MNKRGDKNRSVRHTKRQLYVAMVALLQRKPVNTITVRELTELADINRSTFYLHYRDVYDLLEQMEQQAMEEMRVFLTSTDLLPFRGEVEKAMQAIFTHLYKNRERFQVLFGPNGRKEAKQQAIDSGVEIVTQLLTEQIGLTGFRNVELGIRFVLEGGVGVLEKCYLSEDCIDQEELTQFFVEITELIFRGYQSAI